MSTQLEAKETDLERAISLENIQTQLSGLLSGNEREMQSFKTKMLQLALSDGLKGCTPESIINCGIQALTINLPIVAGQGYVVKYGKGNNAKAQLDIGYKGWGMLAKRSGYDSTTTVVYSCDTFDVHGFAFDQQINFSANREERNIADDKWALANFTDVIVSVRDNETMLTNSVVVEGDTIRKIISGSPSAHTAFSPYNNWAHEMLQGKALKYVLSKMPVDVAKASAMVEAIRVVNETESSFQESAKNEASYYPQDTFNKNWPQWVRLVESGKDAMSMISQLSNTVRLTNEQLEKLYTLKSHAPIEGDAVVIDDDKPEAKTPTQYDEATFKTIYAGWMNLVEAGKLNPDSILADKAHALTDAQVKSVKGLVDAMPVAEAS